MPHANVHNERPEIPGIKKLVEEMQDYALKHPYDPEDAFKGVYVDEGCRREFTYDGVKLSIVLSADRHKTQKGVLRVWSVSFIRIDGKPMKDEWIEPLATWFFEDQRVAGPVVVNPPNPLIPHQKQYGQKIPD
jgi:hypothetical protein